MTSKEILQKADIWGIRAFLLQDQPLPKCSFEDYETYLQRSEQPVFELLEQTFQNAKELDNATDLVSRALSAREDVYLEIGLRAGARLLYQLFYETHD